jgi:hypothetical protein
MYIYLRRVLVVQSRCSGRRYVLKEIRIDTVSATERDR